MSRTGSVDSRKLLVPALLLACAVPLAYQFFRPFVTLGDNNTAAFAQPARNLLRYGPIATKLGLVTDMGPQGGPFYYNTHHPPLVAAAAAAVFLVTGVHDWAARIYPAACALGSAWVLFLLWRRARGQWPAAAAILAMATLPAFGHYGKMLGEEAPTLFWALLAAHLYYEWKDAGDGGSARLGAALAAYAVGCLNGWAAFQAGPVLFADALVTLRARPEARRKALAGFAAVGIACFAAAFGHIVLLSGGTSDILRVAWGRLAAEGSELPGDRSVGAWIAAEETHFLRLYGTSILYPAAAGLLAGVVALLRKRARSEGLWTLAMLGIVGVVHPLVFRWAAFNHEWMLFHLMPLLAVGAGEAIVLASALLRRPLAGTRWSRAAGIAAAAVVLSWLAASGAAGTWALDSDAPGYAWPLLGREVAAMSPGDGLVLASFPFNQIRSAALRFYADRRVEEVVTPARFDHFVPAQAASLYVRDLDDPLDPELERRLQPLPYRDVGMFRIHQLGPEAPGSEPEAPAQPPWPPLRVALEASFGGRLRLTGYEISPVPPPPGYRGLLPAFLGFERGLLDPSRVVRVRSFWTVIEGEPPAWKLITGLTRRGPEGAWLGVPSLVLPEKRAETLAAWQGRGSFEVVAAFFPAPGLPAGPWEIRFGLFDRGVAVPPRTKEPLPESVKILVAGEVVLFF